MGLICSRIGCREKAAASLQFDAERSTAILIDLTHSRNGMPLCERHASSRTAPVGWQLVDRRTGARKLEIWSAEDEGKPAPDFAAPTDRPSAKRPQEPMTRRANDDETAAGGDTQPVARHRPKATPADAPGSRTEQPTATTRPAAAPAPTSAAPAPGSDADVPTGRPSTRRPTTPAAEPATEPSEAAAPEQPTEGFRWPKQSEQLDDEDDDDGKRKGLAADSPLLSRAFRAAK